MGLIRLLPSLELFLSCYNLEKVAQKDKIEQDLTKEQNEAKCLCDQVL